MDSKQYAELAHQANLQGKVLEKDGDKYVLVDPPAPTEKVLAEIEAERVEAEKTQLRNNYIDALMAGDTTKAKAIQADFKALSEQLK
jgi:hypothetical protein